MSTIRGNLVIIANTKSSIDLPSAEHPCKLPNFSYHTAHAGSTSFWGLMRSSHTRYTGFFNCIAVLYSSCTKVLASRKRSLVANNISASHFEISFPIFLSHSVPPSIPLSYHKGTPILCN